MKPCRLAVLSLSLEVHVFLQALNVTLCCVEAKLTRRISAVLYFFVFRCGVIPWLLGCEQFHHVQSRHMQRKICKCHFLDYGNVVSWPSSVACMSIADRLRCRIFDLC